MRVLFIVLVFNLLIFSKAAFSVETVDIATYDVLPPYAFRDDNKKLTGIYIETVQTALSRMPGYDAKFTVVPWARAKRLTKEGKTFAILAPYFHAYDWLTDTEPKRPYIWPYSLRLYTQTDIVICQKDVFDKPRVKFPEDYEGLSFVMWRGDGRAGIKFDDYVKHGKIKLAEVNDVKTTLLLMLSPEISVWLLSVICASAAVTPKVPKRTLSATVSPSTTLVTAVRLASDVT